MLKRKAGVVFIFLLIVVFVFTLLNHTIFIKKILAQEKVLDQKENILIKNGPVELEIESLYFPYTEGDSSEYINFPANTEHPDPNNIDHELLLTSDGLQPNTEFYVAGCINTDQGLRCTTGVSKYDDYLNTIPGGDTMFKDPSYEFKALDPNTGKNKLPKTDESGKLSVIVRSFTAHATSHVFNAYYLNEEPVNQKIIDLDISITPKEALHLQTFKAIKPTPQPTRIPRKVIKRHQDWDPKGRTFDSKSLEPILDTEIALLDNFKNLFVYKSIINPQKVKGNGEFNFFVPNGIYYLDIIKKPATHLWPNNLTDVNSNYTKAYYCDSEVKDAMNNPVSLYYEQFTIIEYNKLVHCDIPLDPGINEPYHTDVTTLDYGISREANTANLNYSGRVSHPLTQIQLIAEGTGSVVASTNADKLGFWRINLLAGNYPLNKSGMPDRIVLIYIKTDLTGQNLKMTKTRGGVFEPILRYIEGYAYDTNGKIIPNAKVGIKQRNTENIIYLASADTKGYFRVGTQYLPSLPYDLVFAFPDSNKELILSASQFMQKNSEYLKTKKLNLVIEDKRDITLSTKALNSSSNINLPNNQAEASEDIKDPSNEKENLSQNTSLIVILLLIITAGGIIAYKKIKKDKSPSIDSFNQELD